ncbi:MAG: DUF5814 domain-containing protein [Candidatus Thorarchaeota archaeon]
MPEIRRYYAILFSPVKRKDAAEIWCFTKGKLSSRAPRAKGFVQFYYKSDHFLRPVKLIWEEGGRQVPASPDGIQILLEKCHRILLDRQLDSKLKEDLMRYFGDFQLSHKVMTIERCSFCAYQNRTTILYRRKYYQVFEGQNVCRRCALDELKKELAAKKIRLDATTVSYAEQILDKTRKLDSAVSVFSRGASNIGEHTLIREIEAEKEIEDIPVAELDIPESLKNIIIKQRKITSLLPVQALAVTNGLLTGRNLLIVASTTAGKTLLGELAGVSRVLNGGGKMIFCVPLVALANEKYRIFKEYYHPIGLKVAIRVGKSRVRVREGGAVLDDANVQTADIIVGTYEGLDFLLRSTPYQLQNVGCVVIDEIQTLDDPERGPILDGLIARLRGSFPSVHIIGLSATVGNPEELADELGVALINLKGRPVPLEEHVVVVRNKERKPDEIAEIIEQESKHRSRSGYRGQTLCFTNSRRNASRIAGTLANRGLRVSSYHAGLPFSRRKKIENGFAAGKVQAVIATFALGAGVDFPASAVVFESLMMGKDVLNANAFSQMLGRAGRLGKHDRGRVLLLVSSDPVSPADSRSELEVAFHLLNSELEPVLLEYDEDYCADQILATVAALSSKKLTVGKLKKTYNSQIGATSGFVPLMNSLVKKNFISLEKRRGPERKVFLTEYGRSAAVSFLRPTQAAFVKNGLLNERNPLDIALELEPLESIYLSPRLHGYLERTFRTRFGTRLLTGPALDIMEEASRSDDAEVNLDEWILEVFGKWSIHFFNCRCEDSPYCNCGRLKINREIIRLRKSGLDPVQISLALRRTYELSVYPGDVFKWLDSILYRMDGIRRVGRAINHPARIGKLIRQIENPRRFLSETTNSSTSQKNSRPKSQ